MEDVQLEVTADALSGIAQKAIARKTGARGLRSIMEQILLEPMFDIPGQEDVEKVIVNREVVEGKAKPVFVHGSARAKGAGATA